MKQIAIIADDLTGASDTGVQFTQKGLRTLVIFDIKNLFEDAKNVNVVVIDTDSRSLTSSAAYQKIKEVSQVLKPKGYKLIYKKIDSTLRGNIGAEIDAIMDVITFDFAAIVPAYPKMGRTTIEGQHFLHGVPIDKTEIANDPICPVKDSNIVSLLSSQSKRNIGLVNLQTIRSGIENIKAKVDNLLKKDVQLIVFDSETSQDLKIVTEYLSSSNYQILWVGSAGLAESLLDALEFTFNDISQFKLLSTENPVLLVIGSISKITQQQLSIILKQPNVTSVKLDPLNVLKDEQYNNEISRCLVEIKLALKKGFDVAFHVNSSPEIVQKTQEIGKLLNIPQNQISNRIADALGIISSQVIKEIPLQGLILTGGDTAKSVCKHLGVRGLKLIKELEPGVPISQLIGFGNLLAITKAGAFGTERTLINAVHFLKGDR
ncbi:four-carbon acid sugar kinase family protein [Carboxydothermus hydrogenoformans]|uniref:Type III effector Hop protein n=1 Tax=Carboxydothermus hydrogenoformans (strain ATCC BAA-161 / DSM 6008 / Z-2901) TaxID=246194 RepID=Q3ACP2_CARHZ|nr:four-carbon acid sugar kinase family protein [Carboxydothermus hydrogenoformans]ABB13931.1 conserved hypothetical protein [Carboxydothermus hydrogenoformans Z-2901]